MRRAPSHPRVLGFLGRALSMELSAVQQYLTQASFAEAWGLPEASQRFRQETVEEMQHAERLVQRMLALGAAPNASQIRPAGCGRNLVELLQADQRLEADIVALYAEATAFCRQLGDQTNAEFFAALLAEEQHHAQEIDAWLAALQQPAHPSRQAV